MQLVRANIRVASSGRSPTPLLLALGPEPPSTDGFTRASERLALDLRVVHHASLALRGLYEVPLALIRPDQVVAWRGASDADAQQVLRAASGN